MLSTGSPACCTLVWRWTAFAPEHGDAAETLLRNADSAMYVAKASGRNNAQAYRDGMQTRAHQRLVVEARLREAIDNHELALHYQPKLDAATGAVRYLVERYRQRHELDFGHATSTTIRASVSTPSLSLPRRRSPGCCRSRCRY